MKKLLVILFLLIGYFAKTQVLYNPSNFTVTNKSLGVGQGVTTDARSWMRDTTIAAPFMRNYASRAEANTYLYLAKYRTGHFSLYIDSISQTWEYWYRNGTADTNLVLKYNFPVTIDSTVWATLFKVRSDSTLFANEIVGKLSTTLPSGQIFVGNPSNIATAVTPNNDLSITTGGSATVNNQWKQIGNAGTTDVTNFIGTTDNVPLTLKVNNQPSARLTSSGNQTYFGYQAGNGTNSLFTTAIGFQALQNNIGNYSTAIGYQSLQSNTSGNHNVGIGYKALQLNTTGINNTAIGDNALGNSTSGQNNTAVGSAAFNNVTTAQFGVALGWDAAGSVTTGDSTTAIGYQTGFNVTTGHLNTFVGTNTGLGIVTGGYNTILGANVTGLPSTLNNNIIIADGLGNKRLMIDSLGIFIQNSTAAVKVPSGTTAQRPSGVAGYLRYNPDSAKLEFNNGSVWATLSSGGTGGSGTVTSVGSGFSLGGGPITGSGTLAFDSAAGGTGNGFHTRNFNDVRYQGTLTLTTTGSSGAATLIGNTLNIPQYSGGGSSFNSGQGILKSTSGDTASLSFPRIKRTNWNGVVNMFGIGDSYMTFGALEYYGKGFFQMLRNVLGVIAFNYGISGQAYYEAAKNANAQITNTSNAGIVLMAGLNAVRSGGSQTGTLNSIFYGATAVIASNCLDTIYAGNSSSISRSGSWTSEDMSVYGGRSTSGAPGAYSKTNGNTASTTLGGNTLFFSFIGKSTGTATVSISVDGSTYVSARPLSNWNNGISLPPNDNLHQAGVIMVTGVGWGAHNIVVTVGGSDTVRLDYIANCKSAQNVYPVLVGQIPYLNAASRTIPGYGLGTNGATDSANAMLLSAVQQFVAYPVSFVYTQSYFDTTRLVDNIHPDSIGHYQIFQAFMEKVVTSNNSAVAAGNTGDMQFKGVNGAFNATSNMSYNLSDNRLRIYGKLNVGDTALLGSFTGTSTASFYNPSALTDVVIGNNENNTDGTQISFLKTKLGSFSGLGTGQLVGQLIFNGTMSFGGYTNGLTDISGFPLSDFIFKQGPTDLGRMNSAGQFLISATAPATTEKLNVNGDAYFTPNSGGTKFSIGGLNAPVSSYSTYTYHTGATTTVAMRNDDNNTNFTEIYMEKLRGASYNLNQGDVVGSISGNTFSKIQFIANQQTDGSFRNNDIAFLTGNSSFVATEAMRISFGTVKIGTSTISTNINNRGLYSARSIGMLKDSADLVSGSGVVMALGIDTTTGKFVRFVPGGGSSTPDTLHVVNRGVGLLAGNTNGSDTLFLNSQNGLLSIVASKGTDSSNNFSLLNDSATGTAANYAYSTNSLGRKGWYALPTGGVTTMNAFGSTPNSNGASISGSTLTLQPANGSNPGGVSTTTQTLAGLKTFSNDISIPHLIGTTATPSIAAGTGAGTSPTVSIAGNDMAGEITIVAGTAPTAGQVIATVTFTTTLSSTPRVFLQYVDLAVGAATVLVPLSYQATTSSFAINSSTVAGLATGLTYHLAYFCVQ